MRALELIILAAVAAVVLFQLYAVLGRRVGRGPDEAGRTPAVPLDMARPATAPTDSAGASQGVAAIRSRDPSFDAGQFVVGARAAYQTIVAAFAAGDRAALANLLAPGVLAAFESAMQERESQGRTESVEFLHTPRADFEGVKLTGDVAQAAVRFIAEFRTRTKDASGEAVDDRRTAEVWTFERNVKSRNPNWMLIHVDAAEA